MLQWWAAWGLAFGSGSGWDDVQWWVSILSPIFTMNILLNTAGTGVPQANGKNLKRYYDKCPEEYAKYREETSILIPMIGYKYVPIFLKRTIFLDLGKLHLEMNIRIISINILLFRNSMISLHFNHYYRTMGIQAQGGNETQR